jgi:hypothetical protein
VGYENCLGIWGNAMELLHKRNEFLIGSHHPLRETLINQTGDTLDKRVGFLSKIYQEVQLNPLLAWEPEYEFAITA